MQAMPQPLSSQFPLLANPHPLPAKQYKVVRMAKILSDTTIGLMVHQASMDTTRDTELRAALKKVDWRIAVIQHRLFRKLIDGTAYSDLAPLARSTAAFYYTKTRELKPALEIIQKEKRLLLLGMYVDGVVLDSRAIVRYANLPPRDQLQSELLGTLEMPIQSVLTLLQSNQTELLACLQAHTANQNVASDSAVE